jgi:hypothetical protein
MPPRADNHLVPLLTVLPATHGAPRDELGVIIRRGVDQGVKRTQSGDRLKGAHTGSRVATGNTGQGAPFRDVVVLPQSRRSIPAASSGRLGRWRLIRPYASRPRGSAAGQRGRLSHAANRILFDPRLLACASRSLHRYSRRWRRFASRAEFGNWTNRFRGGL